MGECQLLEECRLFMEFLGNAPDMIVEGYKQQWCRYDCSHCARYVVAVRVGRSQVPVDLFPHESRRAAKLLQQHGVFLPESFFQTA